MDGITDAQWTVLAPLVDACRPKGKTEPHNLGSTLAAIFWRHRQGAAWRAIPAELGPGYTAAQLFLRWSKLGVWQRLLAAAQGEKVSLGMVFQRAAGARKRRRRLDSETCAKLLAAAVAGMVPRPAGSLTAPATQLPSLAPGQAHELPQAPTLLARLPRRPKGVVADRDYTNHAFCEHIWRLGAHPAILPLRHEAPVACPPWVYNNHNRVEQLWSRLKE